MWGSILERCVSLRAGYREIPAGVIDLGRLSAKVDFTGFVITAIPHGYLAECWLIRSDDFMGVRQAGVARAGWRSPGNRAVTDTLTNPNLSHTRIGPVVTQGRTGVRSLRILLVTARYVPEIGGTEIHTKELAERLAQRGHKVTVLTTDLYQELPAFECIAGVEVRRVRAWPRDRDYFFAPEIYRVISQGDWDLVHCQGYHTLVAPIAMLAARQARLPYIVAFHSGGHSSWLRRALRGPQRRLLRPLLANATWLVGSSSAEAHFFQQALRLPPEQFRVIPIVANLPVVAPPEPASDGRTLITSVGRLERYKGHHRLIEALPLIMQHVPNAHVRIAGDGPYKSALLCLAQELEIAEHVEIKGIPLSHREDMARLMLRAALVVSLSDYESAGIAVREALALHRPVLVTEVPGYSELAGTPRLHMIPRNSSREQIAAAVVDCLREPLAEEAIAMPSWDACVEMYEALYLTAVQRAQCAS